MQQLFSSLITLVSNTFSFPVLDLSIFPTKIMRVFFCIFLFLSSFLITSSSGSLPDVSYNSKTITVDEESRQNKLYRKRRDQIIPSRRGKLLENGKTALHDSINPSTEVFSTTPPSTMPPDSATPTIVTVPAAFPGTVTPSGPAFSNAPITITPSVGPLNQPPPITYPVTTPTGPIVTIPGVQPITNPVTTYPAPGNIPATTPVVNPVGPPAMTNPPAISGQSWCVARNGATEPALQAALDYACGTGGSDCSLIQQGGSCYNPNTLQNHASFAFNSYYQKNLQSTSCDFGGTASIVNTNPSTGSCIYPSSLSSSSPLSSTSSPPSTVLPTSPPSTVLPISPSILTPVTPASPLGSYNTPTVLNSSYPTSGSTTAPGSSFGNNPSSMAAESQPYIGSIIMITTLMTVKNLMCLLN